MTFGMFKKLREADDSPTNRDDDVPPLLGRYNAQTSLSVLLSGLFILPILALSTGAYWVALVLIVTAYLINHYSALRRYELRHVPEMRWRLYRDWPISYAIAFATSFLSENWQDIIVLAILFYNGIAEIRLGKKIVRSYFPNLSKSRDSKNGQQGG